MTDRDGQRVRASLNSCFLIYFKTAEVSKAITKERIAASHFRFEMIEHKSKLTRLYYHCQGGQRSQPPAQFLLS